MSRMKSSVRPRSRRLTPAVLGWLTVVLVAGALAPLAAAVTADHLIISEVNWPGTRAPRGSQCIKIVNPTASAVAMDDVYLTDATLSPGVVYPNIVYADPAAHNPGGTAAQDFHVRFPAGYSIAAGDTVIIAVNGSDEYETEYGVLPDFELVEDALAPDAVPELAAAFPGGVNVDLAAIGTTPVLDNVGESLVLYTWDGSSDLVQDIDYVFWGANTAFRIDKSGLTVGSSTYLDDTAVASQTAADSSPLAGESLRRADDDEGDGETGPGNGITGHDETGENLGATFAVQTGLLGALPPAAPAPAAPVLADAATDPAAPHAGGDATVSISTASYSAVTGVTFHYTVDGGSDNTLVGVDAAGTWSADIPQQAEGAVVAWWAEAANADGGSAVIPASAPLYANTFTVAAEPVAGEGAEKLLITEVNAGPNFYPEFGGMEDLASEFVEIYNPNAYDVDLSDYYLTDSISYVAGSQVYWNISQDASESGIGGGNYNDFFARFPDGFMIGSEEVIVVSMAGSGWFEGVYGFAPDLELYEDGASADAVPDMRPVFTNGDGGDSIYTAGRTAGSDGLERGIPELEEYYGEPVILFQWNGASDLVTDVDIFQFGDSKTGTYATSFDKSGVTVGASTYQAETAVGSQVWFTPIITDPADSYTRTDLDETGQTASGSNGVDGRDETSEDWSANFESAAASPGELEGGGNGGNGGEPGEAAKLLLTEVSYGRNVYPFQSIEDFSQDFVEIYNPNDFDVDMSDYYLTDATSYYAAVNFGEEPQVYYNIASGAINQDRLGGGDYSDFFARFPDGFTIGANEIIVVSIAPGDLYEDVFSVLPDLALYEADGHTSDAPVMRDVFSGSRWGGNLSDEDALPELDEHYGEIVVLFFWDGQSDLVTDVDFFANGTSKSGQYGVGFDKTGVTSGSSTYADDTAIDDQAWYSDVVEDGVNSYQRVVDGEGDQVAAGGNGVDGRDETSEDFVETFAPAAFTPGTWEYAGSGGGGEETDEPVFQLEAQAATFMPRDGDEFPFRFKISSADFEFRLRIFDQEGRVVRTLYDNRFDEAILTGIPKTVTWDGRNDTYELVRAGLYIAHFSVVDAETGEEVTETMPVVVASRLDK